MHAHAGSSWDTFDEVFINNESMVLRWCVGGLGGEDIHPLYTTLLQDTSMNRTLAFSSVYILTYSS